jgi:alanine-synthesizing transaminase
MQYAVVAALKGDRSHQVAFRSALRERGQITADSLNAIPGMHCVAPRATFYVLPSVTLPPGHTDEQFVLALLRETGILCVHGSGFGMPAEQGFFRIVFLADPQELASIYADIGTFTSSYLARA